MTDQQRTSFRERLVTVLRRCPDVEIDVEGHGVRRRLVLLTTGFEEFQVAYYPTPDLWVMETVLSITRKWTTYRPYIEAYRRRVDELGRAPETLNDLLTLMRERLGEQPSETELLQFSAEFWTAPNAARTTREWTKARLLYSWSQRLHEAGLDSSEDVRGWARTFRFEDAMRTLRVKGIGPTSFFYLRMLALGDGIKPDTHVLEVVRQLLEEPKRRKPSRELVEDLEEVAREVGTTPLLLDNSFWSVRSGEYPPGTKLP